MKTAKFSRGEVGRVTPCAPFASHPTPGTHGVTCPTLRFTGSASVFLISLLLFSVTLVQAQYSIVRHRIGGGGGSSSGGSYSVSSTIGTTGGGATASGGSFSVTSSPWMVAVVETPDAPKLSIATVGGSVQVSWPVPSTGWVLQQNTNSVSSVNWSNVTIAIQDDGTTRTLIVNPPTGNRFYRLSKAAP